MKGKKQTNNSKKTKKHTASVSTAINWNEIKLIIKKEDYYKKSVLDEIIECIESQDPTVVGSGLPLNLTLFLGVKPEGLDFYREDLILAIQKDFLNKLVLKDVIRDLDYKTIYDREFGEFLVQVNFVCDNVIDLKDRAEKFISDKLNIEDKDNKFKFIKRPKFTKDKVVWGRSLVVFKGYHSVILEEVSKNPSYYQEGKLIEMGMTTPRRVLEYLSGYSSPSFYNAVKRMNTKFRKAGFPIKIISKVRNNYIMDINLSRSN